MRHFPVFLATHAQTIVLVGGGEAIAQKYRLVSRANATIQIMAEDLTGELSNAVAEGAAQHSQAILDPEVFTGARLVIISTGCAALDAAAADLARARGALVNVVDRPHLSDVIMPAIVDRDPVVIAIGTEGNAPVLARQIKTRLEQMLEPGLGRFARQIGAMRADVSHRIAPSARRRFWEWVMREPRRLFASGQEDEATARIGSVLAHGEPPSSSSGRITVLDPGTGAADLLSLRAVERLQTADLVIHDADCPRAILDLARRDADREVVGPDKGPRRWRRDYGARLAIAAAEQALSQLAPAAAAAVTFYGLPDGDDSALALASELKLPMLLIQDPEDPVTLALYARQLASSNPGVTLWEAPTINGADRAEIAWKGRWGSHVAAFHLYPEETLKQINNFIGRIEQAQAD